MTRKRHKKLPQSIPSSPARVKVGFPAGKAGGININKAMWNEFGTKGGASGGGWGGPIPERPFFRTAMRSNQAKYRNALRSSAAAILMGEMSLVTVLNRLGIMAQGDIQASITSWTSPPNSPVTIARKGSSKPLIDTGAMRASVTWIVE